METDRIKHAKAEAIRFIDAACRVLTERKDDPTAHITGTAKSGSLRRASLDLTRALADMRKP